MNAVYSLGGREYSYILEGCTDWALQHRRQNQWQKAAQPFLDSQIGEIDLAYPKSSAKNGPNDPIAEANGK